jgi:putative membrane protein
MKTGMRGRTAAFAGVLVCACASIAVQADDEASSTSMTTSTFVQKAAQDGMTEVEMGKLALDKSHDSDVRAFADQMVSDHDKANMELKSVAKSANVQVPTEIDSEHRSMVDKLRTKSGEDFDEAYAKAMADDHAKAVAMFKSAASSSDLDPQVATFAKKTLPTLEHHKSMADQLAEGEHTAQENTD